MYYLTVTYTKCSLGTKYFSFLHFRNYLIIFHTKQITCFILLILLLLFPWEKLVFLLLMTWSMLGPVNIMIKIQTKFRVRGPRVRKLFTVLTKLPRPAVCITRWLHIELRHQLLHLKIMVKRTHNVFIKVYMYLVLKNFHLYEIWNVLFQGKIRVDDGCLRGQVSHFDKLVVLLASTIFDN